MTLDAATSNAVAALAARFGLPATAASQLQQLAALLIEDPSAPTAVRDPPRVVQDHLADSLVALELDVMNQPGRAVDIGSGAGLPGIPLAIACPQIQFSLLESNHRKVEFLARAVSSCGLTNAEPIAERAESWSAGLGDCDLVTARAVSELAVVAEYAAPLLRVGGTLVAWRGRRDAAVEARAERAAEILGLELAEPVRVQPFPTAMQRHLHLLTKVSPTPAGFPRRPGLAAKRTLGRAGENRETGRRLV